MIYCSQLKSRSLCAFNKLVLRNREVNCLFYAMFLIRINPFTYHNIDTLNLGRVRRSGFYFGTSLSRFLSSETIKQANMANLLLSNKHLDLLKPNEPVLRMNKETVNVGRITPRYFISVALGLSRFVRSGKDQHANKANPLLANTRLLKMNESFLRMDAGVF